MLYEEGSDDTLVKDELEGDLRERRAGAVGQKEVAEVPLEVKLTNTPVKELGEGSDIKEETKTDESIKGLRELADRRLKGYRWENQLVIRERHETNLYSHSSKSP